MSVAITPSNVLSELLPSTLTAVGSIENVKINEKDFIEVIKEKKILKPGGNVQKATCNYGTVQSKDYKQKEQKKKSNRGRKPKPPNNSNRVKQGNGKCFSSQITFDVFSVEKNKYYKIKLFRNGMIQIPGVLNTDMSDIKQPINDLINVLSGVFENVSLIELYSIMRNYKTAIKDDRKVNLRKLYQILIQLKDSTPMLNEVKYNPERYPGLIVKFGTPIDKNKKKQATIKMFHSGKINIDGLVSEQHSTKYYNWVESVYNDYKSQVLYTPIKLDL